MDNKITFARTFLFKWFFIGLIIYIISVVAYIFLKDFSAELVFTLFGIQPDFYFHLSIALFAYMKLFLILFLLSPALALHCIIKCKGKCPIK